MIVRDFPFAPPRYVKELLRKHDHLLSPSYLELEETINKWNDLPKKPWTKNFDLTQLQSISKQQEEELDEIINTTQLKPIYREEFEELRDTRTVRAARDKMRQGQEASAQYEESEDVLGLTGAAGECQCCFDDQPVSKMVHCNGEKTHVSREHRLWDVLLTVRSSFA